MNTDTLIAAIAADTRPQPRVGERLFRAIPVAFGVSAALFLLIWGVRPDILVALTSATLVKTLLPFVLAGLAGALALGLSRPEGRPLGRTVVLGGFGAVLLVAFAGAVALSGVSSLVAALSTPSLAVCLISIPILAVPFLFATLWALSNGAPLRPARAGAVAGLVAGGLAATIYSLYCDEDALLFFLPAYSAAVLFISMMGAVIGGRVLKW